MIRRKYLVALLATCGLFLQACPPTEAKTPSDNDRGWQAYYAHNYAEAMRYFEAAARTGNADAMNGIGILFYEGSGVERDYKMAARWYEEAVKRGQNNALTNLGWIYDQGLTGSRDEQLALDFYTKAVERGHYDGLLYLAYHYEDKGDYVLARRMYEAAAARNIVQAYANLGYYYTSGRGGNVEDCKAADVFRKGVAANDPQSINNLGALYYNGRCFSTDKVQARKYFKIAADFGNSDGISNLAMMDAPPPPVYSTGGSAGYQGSGGCDAGCAYQMDAVARYTDAAVAASYNPPPPSPPWPTISPFFGDNH